MSETYNNKSKHYRELARVSPPLSKCIFVFALMVVSLYGISNNVVSAVEDEIPLHDQTRALHCLSPRACRDAPLPLHCFKGTEVPESGPLSILFMVANEMKCHPLLLQFTHDLEVNHHVSYSSERWQEGNMTTKMQQSLKQIQFDVVFNFEGCTGTSADVARSFITPSPSTTLYVDGGPAEFNVVTFRRGGVIPAEKGSNFTLDYLLKWIEVWLKHVRAECAPWNSVKPTPMPILLVMEPLGLKTLQDSGERIVKSLMYLSAAGLIDLHMSNPLAPRKSMEAMNDALRIGVGMRGGIVYRSSPHVFFDTNVTTPSYDVIRDGGLRVMSALLATASEIGISPVSAEEDALILRWKLLNAFEGKDSDVYRTPLFDSAAQNV